MSLEFRQVAEYSALLIVVNNGEFEIGLNEPQRMTGVPNSRRNGTPAASLSSQPSLVVHSFHVPHPRPLHGPPARATHIGYAQEGLA